MKALKIIRRWWKHAAIAGVVLAMVCPFVPPQYRGVCDVLADICSRR